MLGGAHGHSRSIANSKKSVDQHLKFIVDKTKLKGPKTVQQVNDDGFLLQARSAIAARLKKVVPDPSHVDFLDAMVALEAAGGVFDAPDAAM